MAFNLYLTEIKYGNMEEKKQFFLKLNPPLASFTLDMTAEEGSIMQAHAAVTRNPA